MAEAKINFVFSILAFEIYWRKTFYFIKTFTIKLNYELTLQNEEEEFIEIDFAHDFNTSK